jgi:hypothetical protein
LEKRKIFVPTTIPEGGKDTVHTMTPRLPKYHPRTGHEGRPLLFYNLERNPLLIVQDAGLVPDRPSHSEMLYPHHKGVKGQKMYNLTISSELDAEQWLTSRASWFNLQKEPWCPLTEGWLGSRDGLVDLERRKILYLLGLELGWLVGWLVVRLVGGLVGWLVCRLVGQLVGWVSWFG